MNCPQIFWSLTKLASGSSRTASSTFSAVTLTNLVLCCSVCSESRLRRGSK
uniref:Putative LOV domain-containing protein n=1 Tax=Rhizophora mucronata TaxID=61149 RepID=A0A2P2MCA9_RHIMU